MSASTTAKAIVGESVVTNERVLNHALRQAGSIISQRHIPPQDKFELLYSYVLKVRREIFGKVD